MLKNHLKIAFRHLMTDKKGSLLQLMGLSVGICSFLLLMQYVFFEKSYDQYHTQKENIYRVTADIYRNGTLNNQSATTYLALGPSLQRDFAEVENYVRFFPSSAIIQIEEERFREQKLYYVDNNLFEVFSIPLISGEPNTALSAPNSIVISEKLAQRYFGTTDCINQSIELENWHQQRFYTVRGVMENLPENTHLQSDVFLSLTTLSSVPGTIPDWSWRDFYNYLLLKPETAQRLEQKINTTDYIAEQYDRFGQLNIKHELHLQAITDIHLRSNLSLEVAVNGSAQSVQILFLIGLFLLLMAWINYVNLTTAKAITRAKEVGVRKTIGASQATLIAQFLTQSLVLNIIAFGMALLLVKAIQPFFQQLVGKNLSLDWFQNPILLASILVFFVLGLIISSTYPAFVLSRFSPQDALKNYNTSSAKGSLLRKSLIVFQFSLSILLIISTITAFQQLQFMRQKNLGMDISRSISVNAPITRDSSTYAKFNVFKNRLLQNNAIESISAAHLVPGDIELWVPGIRKIPADPNNNSSQIIHLNSIDPSFIPQFELNMLAGRNYYPEEASTHSDGMILTETACKTLEIEKIEDAIGQQYYCMGDTFSVIGVVSDYQQWGFQKAAGDYVFINRPDEFRRYAVKLKGTNLDNSLAFIENTYQTIFSDGIFEYVFLDEHFNQQYQADAQFGKLVSLFASLGIFISCLGLLGLSLFMILQKRKEIGIRKVLGATTIGLIQLLSKDFLKLVVIAFIIATLGGWYFMNEWLENFAHRISLQWWVFALAGLLALTIAFFTVSLQSIKAALANPIAALRAE